MQLRPFRSLDPGDKAMGWRVRASLWAGAPPWPGASPASPPAGLSGGFERRKSVNLVSLPNHLRPQWPCRCPGDTGDWLLHAVTAGVVSRQRVASFLGWKVPEGDTLSSGSSCPARLVHACRLLEGISGSRGLGGLLPLASATVSVPYAHSGGVVSHLIRQWSWVQETLVAWQVPS